MLEIRKQIIQEYSFRGITNIAILFILGNNEIFPCIYTIE